MLDDHSVSCSTFEITDTRVSLQKPSKAPLFCVACETLDKDRIRRPELRYLHGDDAQDAERKFRQAHSREIINGIIRIVAVGPVIGYHVHDSHGEKLSA